MGTTAHVSARTCLPSETSSNLSSFARKHGLFGGSCKARDWDGDVSLLESKAADEFRRVQVVTSGHLLLSTSPLGI